MEPRSPKNVTQAGTVITVDLPLCQIPQTTVLMLPIYFAANPANRPPMCHKVRWHSEMCASLGAQVTPVRARTHCAGQGFWF